ncbi:MULTISPECIES: thiamine phosphate synthase [unclassified Modestobacter]|uniref:thiamine phosphate synthase n=1 Tax=unclassified Modestobacter TaxID=2643866 RepID=UPI0022AA6BB9|nr:MULTISPECIES: thiamine phosphate synthase [unclassified Modestobacter]MCZ2822921.1 thiamine phosphate synthase [Modestobacter sp. VKM Ac-2981]MCZ2851167.1 thiamine phosphate synthase [Modestobacter sp. VKM Ac-2982]
MSLPRLLVLTDRTQCRGSLTATVATAVDAGARAVVLREKDLPLAERARLATELQALLAPVGGVLVWAGAAGSAGRAAVHLSAADPLPTPRPGWLGRSCHTAVELARARAEGCDHAFLSPVFLTASKPGHGPALGLTGLAELVPHGPPVYALGGIGPEDVAGCLAAGARGVAVMGGVMRDPSSVRDHLAALTG